ncbi:putative ubiquitin-like modifier-activating enzyme atg7 [Elsinoe australis]|uniref:Ubiquitin-like modifier-activating enzyme ATG7 n=1 Tax=Elsinoe australis TaxID=40998 RepID=A0A4U7AT25_9PEZI|nr:putative ubiquitin-like modifier-activating enzyme atg7 [Elsinoe australis]
MATSLQYAPWTTEIDLGFYSALAKFKLENDKLESPVRKVLGAYEVRPRDAPERSTSMQIHTSALTNHEVPGGTCRGEGMIRNFNTYEEFKEYDRSAHMERAGRMIWDAINDGSIFSCPSLLSSFSAICFANLKKYTFNYHFAYPALHSDPQWKQDASKPPTKLSPDATTNLVDKVQTWKYSVDARQHGFFLAKRIQSGVATSEEESGDSWQVASLSAYERGFFKDTAPEDRFIAFVDPSTYPTNPGWMLRNLLILVRQRFRLNKVQVLCYRDTHVRREHPTSIILQLQCGDLGGSFEPATKLPKVTGWERNENGKVSARTVDLGAYLDPTRLADQAVDLNLKLIKWRIAPSIDLDVIKNTSCLLLGAGTLGSYVARNLMGWGVRNITFVDNGKVSYSNPVRQPLYNFADCLEGGAKKAERAAEALKQIYPGVNARGIVMSVPMAGHPITEEAVTKRDYDQLYELISTHDAVFLLMDTRESRWLPTVIAKSLGKIVINAALGFDTYMVMRHGIRTSTKRRTSSSSSGLPITERSHKMHPDLSTLSAADAQDPPQLDELGCYFCSDVVAPKDSLKSATLDQQCTVTRPGVAPIASALAVELLVSILQSPLKGAAAAPEPQSSVSSREQQPKEPETTHPLGTVPHQLRGFMSNWSTMTIKGKAYDCCSACSPKIVGEYEREGWEFVKKAVSEQGYVEEVSGLAEVQRRAEEVADDVDWDEEGELEEIDAEGELI